MDLQAHPLRHGKLGQSAQGPGLSLDFSGRAPWNIASQKSRSSAKAPGAARKWGFTATVGGEMCVPSLRRAPDAAGGEIARASRPLNLMQFFSRAPAESLAFFPMSSPQFQLGKFLSLQTQRHSLFALFVSFQPIEQYFHFRHPFVAYTAHR